MKYKYHIYHISAIELQFIDAKKMVTLGIVVAKKFSEEGEESD